MNGLFMCFQQSQGPTPPSHLSTQVLLKPCIPLDFIGPLVGFGTPEDAAGGAEEVSPPSQGGSTHGHHPGEEGTRCQLAPSLMLSSVGPLPVPLAE